MQHDRGEGKPDPGGKLSRGAQEDPEAAETQKEGNEKAEGQVTQAEWWKLWERPLDNWFWKIEGKMKGRKHNVKRKNVKKQQQ